MVFPHQHSLRYYSISSTCGITASAQPAVLTHRHSLQQRLYANKSLEAVEVGGLEESLDELVQVFGRDLLGGEPGAVDVADRLAPIVLVADEAVDSSVLVRLAPNALVVAEIDNRQLSHPVLEVLHLSPHLLLRRDVLHLHLALVPLLLPLLLLLLFLLEQRPFLKTALGGADVEVVGLVPGRRDILHHACLNFGGVLDAAHFLEAAEVRTFVGGRDGLGFPAPRQPLPEAPPQPPLASLVVQYKLMHVVAQVAQQVFGFGEARLVCLWVGPLEQVLLAFVRDQRQRAAVFRQPLFHAVVAVAEFQLVYKRVVERAFAGEGAVEKVIVAWVSCELPILEFLMLTSYSESLRFLEALLPTRSQEYLSKKYSCLGSSWKMWSLRFSFDSSEIYF